MKQKTLQTYSWKHSIKKGTIFLIWANWTHLGRAEGSLLPRSLMITPLLPWNSLELGSFSLTPRGICFVMQSCFPENHPEFFWIHWNSLTTSTLSYYSWIEHSAMKVIFSRISRLHVQKVHITIQLLFLKQIQSSISGKWNCI